MAQAKSKENYVRMILPRVEGEEESLTVTVNGEIYQIRKGVEVEVPPTVAQVIRNSMLAGDTAARNQEKYQNVKIG